MLSHAEVCDQIQSQDGRTAEGSGGEESVVAASVSNFFFCRNLTCFPRMGENLSFLVQEDISKEFCGPRVFALCLLPQAVFHLSYG